MKKQNYKGLLHKNAMSIIEIMRIGSDDNNVIRGVSIEKIFELANLDLTNLYDGINLLTWMQNQKYIKIITEGNTFAYEILQKNLVLNDKNKDPKKSISIHNSNTSSSRSISLHPIALEGKQKKIKDDTNINQHSGIKLSDQNNYIDNFNSLLNYMLQTMDDKSKIFLKDYSEFEKILSRFEPNIHVGLLARKLDRLSCIKILKRKPLLEIYINKEIINNYKSTILRIENKKLDTLNIIEENKKACGEPSYSKKQIVSMLKKKVGDKLTFLYNTNSWYTASEEIVLTCPKHKFNFAYKLKNIDSHCECPLCLREITGQSYTDTAQEYNYIRSYKEKYNLIFYDDDDDIDSTGDTEDEDFEPIYVDLLPSSISEIKDFDPVDDELDNELDDEIVASCDQKIQIKAYVVYQLTLENDKLYIGYTRDINQRLYEHKASKRIKDFTLLYQTDNKLVAKEVEGYFIDLTWESNTNKIKTGVKATKLLSYLKNNYQNNINDDFEELLNEKSELLLRLDEIEEKIEINRRHFTHLTSM